MPSLSDAHRRPWGGPPRDMGYKPVGSPVVWQDARCPVTLNEVTNLQRHVLRDAIAAVTSPIEGFTKYQYLRISEALEWLAHDDTTGYAFSFTECCETWGLSPATVRG